MMLALTWVMERGEPRCGGGEGPEGGPWQTMDSPGVCKG